MLHNTHVLDVNTLLDVQYIVLSEEGPSVMMLPSSLSKGHEAIHLSSHSDCPVQVGSVLTQSLDELCANASL